MAVNFSIQFRINEKTQSRVLRLTDTSTGFTLAKGNFSVTFPDGSTRIKTDFTSPDINTPGAFIDVLLVTDISGAVLTGSYKVDFVALDGANTSYPSSRTFDFNWIKPVKNIVSGTDVLVPEVRFLDNTSYSPVGSFTGTVSRTFSTLMPSNTPQSGTNVIGIGNLINPVFSGNYYEGIYTVKSDISITYTHSTNSWLTLFYTDLLQEIIAVKRAPTQTQLIGFMNTYHVAIEAYEENNDTQFNLLNEQYDLVVALYSHIIARYESGTLDGSEPLLTQLLDILRPYSTHTYTSAPLTPFTLDTIGTTGFVISNGTVSDNFSLGETLLFASGNAALVPTITNNSVIYTPTFGVTPNTFASGSDSRFHDPVTLGGSTNGLSLSTQQLSLAIATTSAAGSMSSVDKAKLDSIAAGAQTGTVTSVGISMPSAFTVSNSPITTLGTIAITANGLSTEFIRGDGATGNFNGVARAAISLTTTGTAGAATYNSTTGVLNVPQYVGGVTSFNTRTGAITLTSGDVTTALTFTPYNATNPNNYIALTALSAGTGISYNNTTGVITNTITQYTDALARLAITLTTTGTSGAATYNSTTGVLNIPAYQGGVTSFNTRTGAITLTSTDVTDALTFTPYNATNPAGYTTNVGTVTSVGGTGTVSGLTLTGSVSVSGNLTLGGTLSLSSGNVTSGLGFTPENAANKGIAGGYASLDGGGLVPSTQLPSYVDDVLEFANLAALPATGETGKIYVTLDTNKIYRWSGSAYIEVSPTVGTIWGGITGTLANQTDLQSALDAKQDDITLTTTGTSGAATLVGATLNIPEYQGGVTSFNTRTGAITLSSTDVTTALTFTPYNATNPSNYIALTALSAGTGISYNNTTGVITNTITQYTDALARAAISATGNISYNSTTGVISTSLTQYTDALARAAISLTTTGTSGAATYNSTTGVLNIPSYQGGVTSFNTRTGAITLTSGDVTTALTYTPYPTPTGDTTQYIAGDGSLVAFPVAGQSGTLVRQVRNETGATLTKGTVVYISGATGNKPTVSKAIATGDSTSAQTFGLVQADISNNSNGYVVCVGDIAGLNTSAFAEGVQLYLSATTAGTYTSTKQYAPNHLVYVGVVTRSHPTQGEIEVKIQNGYELDELHDVAAQTPSNNDGLFYESSTNLWKNKTIATVLGYTPYDATNPNNYIALTALSSTATGLTYTNTTGVFSLTSGYVIPTTTSATNWDTAYTNRITTLTTTGSSGSATLSSNTLNIPTYTLSGLGGQAALSGTGFVKISGTTISYDNSTYYLASNPSAYIALTALSSTATGLTYTNTTGVFSLTSGYVIPTTSSATNWDTAYTNRITTLTTTGSSGSATLASNTLNVPTYTLAGLGGVPTTRTITINGTTFDLSADRTYTITPSASARAEQNFTATAGQTTFTITGGYVVGLVDVFINGARLLPTDYTATNGTTVVLGTGALLNDAVTVLNYTSTIAALPTSRDVIDYTATAAQTTFTVSGGYTVGLLDVYVNGSKLTAAEFTATNGTTFVLTEASVVGNQVQAIRYNASVTGISGSGTANYVPKFTASGTVGNSQIFDNGTNVGIGTASPASAGGSFKGLDIRGTGGGSLIFGSTSTVFSYMYASSSALSIETTSTIPIVFNPAGTERMRITSDGLVGIGSSSPTRSLQITRTSTAFINVEGSTMAFGSSNAPLLFFANNNESMRITSAGDVLMGKTAENAGVAGFQYRGAAPGLVQITRDGGESLQLWRYTSNGKMLIFYYNGTEVGSISSNTSSLPSDYNFKKDITDLSLGLNLIDKLRPVNYRHKIDNDNEPLSNGIIAQELEEALIKCGVKKNELLMLQHTPNEDKTQSEYWVDYTKMIPILIKSIQELSAKITILENK
jgi:hypothetical protein